MKKRLGIISLFILLFIVFIAIWDFSYRLGLEEGYVPVEVTATHISLPSERGVFENSEFTLEYVNMPIDKDHQRSLDSYYNNRAYYGAPPSISHPVKNEISIGGNTCLQCHQTGGFVEKFDAYAPITPHPEMVNCRQCHVAQNSNTLFKPVNLSKVCVPKDVNKDWEGTPHMIPHQIQMRENCLSCHAGPAAPKEIRVSHPERINCKRCHVPSDRTDRGVSELNAFTRTNSNKNAQKK